MVYTIRIYLYVAGYGAGDEKLFVGIDGDALDRLLVRSEKVYLTLLTQVPHGNLKKAASIGDKRKDSQSDAAPDCIGQMHYNAELFLAAYLSSFSAGDELLVLRCVDDGAGARLVEDEGLDEGALLRHQRVPERHVAAVGAVARRAEEAGAGALEHEVRRLLRVALHRLCKETGRK